MFGRPSISFNNISCTRLLYFLPAPFAKSLTPATCTSTVYEKINLSFACILMLQTSFGYFNTKSYL